MPLTSGGAAQLETCASLISDFCATENKLNANIAIKITKKTFFINKALITFSNSSLFIL